MRRLALVLALLGFATSATDLPDLLPSLLGSEAIDGCLDTCPGDTPAGDCSPRCPACLCAPLGSPLLPQVEALILPDHLPILAALRSLPPPLRPAPPRTVFHPPISG